MSKIKLCSVYEDLDKYDCNNGNIVYCKKGTTIVHNPYGPAILFKDGGKEYVIENKFHRLDGPARIWAGNERYFINNKQLTKEEFEKHPERLKFLGKEYLICLG